MTTPLTDSLSTGSVPSFLAVATIVFTVLYLLKVVLFAKVSAWAKKTESPIDDSVLGVGAKVRTVSIAIFALYIGAMQLTLPNTVEIGLKILFLFTLSLELIAAIEAVVLAFARRSIQNSSSLVALTLLIRIVLWVVAMILLLSNIGVNVTSLVASLGIGGLAISLALQSVFQDLFSSFSILIDKPFEAGDFIVISPEYSGTVTHIGLKSTRLQTIQGEELIVPNSQLTNEKIQNFKHLNERTVLQKLGVTYQTSSKLLKEIPALLEKCIADVELAQFNRASFREYADSALVFEVSYKVLSSEFIEYIRVEQAVNLAIFEVFTKKGIEFAYPTQTIFVEK